MESEVDEGSLMHHGKFPKQSKPRTAEVVQGPVSPEPTVSFTK